MIVLPLPWPTKAPFSTGLNGASSKLFFCVYFCLTNALRKKGAGKTVGYSLRMAVKGLSRMARKAGYRPEIMATSTEKPRAPTAR